MAAFVYRCPNTGFDIQAWSEEGDDPTGCLYVPIKCTVCLRAHLVNCQSGHVLGTHDMTRFVRNAVAG
jgi:hypothetical protein